MHPYTLHRPTTPKHLFTLVFCQSLNAFPECSRENWESLDIKSVPRWARINSVPRQAHILCVSLNSRLESNKEEADRMSWGGGQQCACCARWRACIPSFKHTTPTPFSSTPTLHFALSSTPTPHFISSTPTPHFALSFTPTPHFLFTQCPCAASVKLFDFIENIVGVGLGVWKDYGVGQDADDCVPLRSELEGTPSRV